MCVCHGSKYVEGTEGIHHTNLKVTVTQNSKDKTQHKLGQHVATFRKRARRMVMHQKVSAHLNFPSRGVSLT